MILNLDTSGIVLAGHWNRMIFTPEWVGEKLFHEDIILTEIAVVPGFPAIYRNNQVQLEASRARLLVRPRVDTPQAFRRSEGMAVEALAELPNTPLLGVGINFSFIENEAAPELLELFNLKDSGRIEKAGSEVADTRLVRTMTTEFGVMNLLLGYDTQRVVIDINFHTDPNSGGTNALKANIAAREAIEGKILKLKQGCIKFLENIYDLKLETGANDG